MDIQIRRFDIPSATEKEWSALYGFVRQFNKELTPDEPVNDEKTTQSSLRAYVHDNECVVYMAAKKSSPQRIIGYVRMLFPKAGSPSYAGNEDICIIPVLAVLRGSQRNGVGRRLLARAYMEASARKKARIVGQTFNEGGRAFVGSVGGELALSLRDSRLELKDLDWGLVERWEREGRKRSPGSTLKIYRAIPDDILEDYCKVYTEVQNQAPRENLKVGDTVYVPSRWKDEEKRWAEVGATWLSAVIQEPGGEISGLTDVLYVPSKSPVLTQMLTGVQEKYRGSGKGKWVKAAMLLEIRRAFPDITTVRTGNATSNAPMLAINNQLGFRLQREIHAFQVETEKVGRYLRERGVET